MDEVMHLQLVAHGGIIIPKLGFFQKFRLYMSNDGFTQQFVIITRILYFWPIPSV